jgi:hypothetical protein
MDDNPGGTAAAFGIVGAVLGAYFGFWYAGIGGGIAGTIVGFFCGASMSTGLLAAAGLMVAFGFIALVIFSIWHFWGVGKPSPQKTAEQKILRQVEPNGCTEFTPCVTVEEWTCS